jgi:hypothetical protein
MNWQCVSSGRAFALQVRSPELNPTSTKKKKEVKKKEKCSFWKILCSSQMNQMKLVCPNTAKAIAKQGSPTREKDGTFVNQEGHKHWFVLFWFGFCFCVGDRVLLCSLGWP